MAWRVESLDDLKEFYKKIKTEGQAIDHIADHGISLAIYLRDPDGERRRGLLRDAARRMASRLPRVLARRRRPRPLSRPVGRRDARPGAGAATRARRGGVAPSPSQPCGLGPSLSRKRERGSEVVSHPLSRLPERVVSGANRVRVMRTHKIAALGGDGIGPEVVEAGLEVLAVCAERDGGFALDVERFDWGSDYYRKHGVMMPADGADRLRAFDAILFGAVGAPGIPDHITLWGLRLAICQPFDQYANVRPTRILPGITTARCAMCRARRPRLGHRPREFGGRVRRGRWARAPGHGDRDRDRRLDDDPEQGSRGSSGSRSR